MLLKEIPPCYSFAFGTELKDKDEKIVHRNVFQFYINHLFHQHLVENAVLITEIYPFPDEIAKDKIVNLLFEGKIYNYENLYQFESFANDHSIVYNFFLPEYEKNSPAVDFLDREIKLLQCLLRFLELGSIHFSESEEGKQYRKISIYHQSVTPHLYIKPLHFSVKLWNDKLRDVSRAISSSKKCEEQVMLVLESVLGTVDKKLLATVRVSIRHKYIQVQLNTDTAMIIDFSASHDHNEEWHIVSKHVDYPLQLIALFAGLGRIMCLKS